MVDVTLTAARADVLRAVARGEVKHHRNWGHDPDEDVWRPEGGRQTRVTAAVEFLRHAGLVKLGPAGHASMYAPRLWRLTEAGGQWLTEREGQVQS